MRYQVSWTGKPHTIVGDLILPAVADLDGTMLGKWPKKRVEGATGQHLRSKCELACHSRVRDSRCGRERESRKQQVRDKVAGRTVET